MGIIFNVKKMKKGQYQILPFLWILLFSSCVAEEKYDKSKNGGTPIRIIGQDASNATKTTIDGFTVSWIAIEDSIGVYSEQAKLTPESEQGVVNSSFVAESSARSTEFAGEIYWGSGNPHSFYAYYPYYSGSNTVTAIPVTLTQYQTQTGTTNSHIGKLDFMIATPKTGITPGTIGEQSSVDFKFNHLFTILEFKIKLSEGTAKLGGIEMTSSTGNLSLNSATVDITQDAPAAGTPYTLANVSANNKVTLEIIGDCVLTSDYETTASAYMAVLPGNFSGTDNMSIKIITDKGVINVTKNGINFRRGAKYRVQVTDPVVDVTPEDLTAAPANCYMTDLNGTYLIRGDLRGNGVQPTGSYAPTTISTSITPLSVKVLWESDRDIITTSPILSGLNICFATGSAYGNALIAAYDGANCTGHIVWSWHVWSISGGAVFDDDSQNMMPYNLGAYNNNEGDVKAAGLYYQWGRKDPFPSATAWLSDAEQTIYGEEYVSVPSPDITEAPGNIEYSINNPVYFIIPNMSSTSYDWYITENNDAQKFSNLWNPSSKSMYDPCPYGWKVPSPDVWYYTDGFWRDFANYGRYYNPTGVWYPASGERVSNGGTLVGVGSWGSYWTNTSADLDDPGKTYSLIFTEAAFGKYSKERTAGQSIRCVAQ